MKVVFIESKSPGIHVYARNPIPRMGTILLATILKNGGYEAEAVIEELGFVTKDMLKDADVVGVSILTPTANRGYEIARMCREMGKTVIMGGPHATYMPEDALQHCDYVLRGEADETVLNFFKALEKKEGFENIPGLSWWDNGKITHNADAPQCKDLNALPAPDFGLVKHWTRQMDCTPVMTSRGCPFDCEFCSVSDMFGRQFRHKDTEKVLEDLRTHRRLVAENKVKNRDDWVFFVDDNFTINKKRVKPLLQAMIDEKLTPQWVAQVSSDVADDEELLSLIKRSNCAYLFIGFESVNPATLKAYNKKHTLEKIEYSVKKIHEYGIRIHGMFVVGADTDNKDVIRETTRFARRMKLESIQLMILTPLPGTRVYEKLSRENRLTSRDWSLYDSHHVVFKPTNFSEWELQMETAKGMLKFYSWANVAQRMLIIATRLKDFKRQLHVVALTIYGHFLMKEWLRNKKEWISHLARGLADKTIETKPHAEPKHKMP
jgi:radical SAM superfamily enzyme YgiQ (UPF0313 family)